ncbi:DUF433 domain-containing protein [Candidatus Poribacteria bacterium]|nr:MAG: DUF433 domain-containing protein [Candidatus Poribacteria bacterium]
MDTKLIESNPSIMMGKPVIAGTRIPVELILEKIAAGETIEQLLEEYPRLTEEGVRAALHFSDSVPLSTDSTY